MTASQSNPGRRGRRVRRTASPRDNRVNLRVNDAELKTLEIAAKSHRLSVGAYAARSAIAVAQGEIMPIPVDERQKLRAQAQARAELGRIGNNLNQIAHVLNAERRVTPARLADALAQVQSAVRRLDEATISLMDGRRS